jgi:hypothetical protein
VYELKNEQAARSVLVYRIVGSIAMVEGVYHELQDYGNLLR